MNRDEILRLREQLENAQRALAEVRSIMERGIRPEDKRYLAELAKVDASLLAIERNIDQLRLQ